MTYLSKSISKVVLVIPNCRVKTILYKSKRWSLSCPVKKQQQQQNIISRYWLVGRQQTKTEEMLPFSHKWNTTDVNCVHNSSIIKCRLVCMLTYLVKSVLRAPVPAYCTEQASALSAHTKKDGINLKVSKFINIFENDAATNKTLRKDCGNLILCSIFYLK